MARPSTGREARRSIKTASRPSSRNPKATTKRPQSAATGSARPPVATRKAAQEKGGGGGGGGPFANIDSRVAVAAAISHIQSGNYARNYDDDDVVPQAAAGMGTGLLLIKWKKCR